MDERKFKRTINALLNPAVTPFIDAQRVAKSDLYKDLISWAFAHHKQHGDYTYLLKALDIVSKSTIYLPTLEWISDLTGLKYFLADDYEGQDTATPIKFSKDREPKVVSLEIYTQKYRGTRRQVIEDLSARRGKAKKKQVASNGDALARRLPGSFESGKRR